MAASPSSFTRIDIDSEVLRANAVKHAILSVGCGRCWSTSWLGLGMAQHVGGCGFDQSGPCTAYLTLRKTLQRLLMSGWASH